MEASPTQHATQPEPKELEKGVAELVVKLLKRKDENGPGACSYELRDELIIGRKEGLIRVDDYRCSARHLCIKHDSRLGFLIEQLGRNGSFLNDVKLEMGDVRVLQSGDVISVVNHYRAEQGEHGPFAVLIFHWPEAMEAPQKRRRMDGLSTEQEVRASWDMRKVLGKGTFSEVRLGVNVKTGNTAAIKVVDRGAFEKFQALRNSRLSLVHEAELLVSLDHPGIVKCFEWFQTEKQLYLIMELVEGGDLLRDILKGGRFSELDARRLVRHVCEALAYLHEKDVIHRDVKPDNVLLSCAVRSECQGKLADLGLALRATNATTMCGTPHYFAPEVISSQGGYGKGVDVWGLGVVLYVLLSAQPPFEEEGLYEQILAGDYDFDEDWDHVSEGAKDLVRSLMTVDPLQRPSVEKALKHPWLGESPKSLSQLGA